MAHNSILKVHINTLKVLSCTLKCISTYTASVTACTFFPAGDPQPAASKCSQAGF